ncbi:MAG: hypothetical protein R2712_12255 [Vicinamibacterales bacterium]
MSAVAVFERQDVPVGGGAPGVLAHGEAEALEALAERVPGLCDRRYRSVRMGSYCGLVPLGARVLEVLPKIDVHGPPEQCRGILLNLLQRGRDRSVFRQLAASQQLRTSPLLEVFIAAFFDEVRAIVRGGLLREYQLREDDLRMVRGQVRLSRQFSALADRRDLVSCRFDELTADNAWNRLIKAGLRVVRAWIDDIDLSRVWVELLIAFDEVADVPPSADTYAQLKWDRKASRYRPAVEWARRIMSLLSPALRAGDAESPGLLFDMDRLWESAVAAELSRQLDEAGIRVQAQSGGRYLAAVAGTNARVVGLRPDLLLKRHGRVVGVGDTKWKRAEPDRNGFLIPNRDDVYQMNAYAAAYQCDRLALIYPWHEGLVGTRESVLELPGVGELRPRLQVMCIDVRDGRFDVVLGRATFAGVEVEGVEQLETGSRLWRHS